MLEGEWVRDEEKLLGSSVEHESLDLLPGRPPKPGGLLMGAVYCGVHTALRDNASATGLLGPGT